MSQERTDLERAIACYPEGSHARRLVDNRGGRAQGCRVEELVKKRGNLAAALTIEPKYAPAYSLQAQSLLALRRHKEAGEALDHYFRFTVQPTATLLKARGLIHHDIRQYRAAVEMYTLALHQDPADNGTRCLRGWSYLYMNAAWPALEDFEEVLKDAPNNVDALAGRGNAQIHLAGWRTPWPTPRPLSITSDRLLYDVARIYALAVAHIELKLRAGQDTRRPVPNGILHEQGWRLPRTYPAAPSPEKRAAFWREVVQNDPALASIRRSRIYIRFG